MLRNSLLLIHILLLNFGTATAAISEKEFFEVLDKIEMIYSPIVGQLNGQLVVNKRWTFHSKNPFAAKLQERYILEITGGLARDPLITKDAFALAICHELGHLLGGAPLDKREIKKIYSVEGQADYFATSKCLRLYFQNEDNEAFLSSKSIPPKLRTLCLKAHRDRNHQSICIRSGLAALTTGEFFALISKTSSPKIETPDATSVATTLDAHPKAQCRVDTLIQGAVCERSAQEAFSDSDEIQGACHKLRGDRSGLRPRCWFMPKDS